MSKKIIASHRKMLNKHAANEKLASRNICNILNKVRFKTTLENKKIW